MNNTTIKKEEILKEFDKKVYELNREKLPVGGITSDMLKILRSFLSKSLDSLIATAREEVVVKVDEFYKNIFFSLHWIHNDEDKNDVEEIIRAYYLDLLEALKQSPLGERERMKRCPYCGGVLGSHDDCSVYCTNMDCAYDTSKNVSVEGLNNEKHSTGRKSFFDMPEREQREHIDKATQESNRMQRELVEHEPAGTRSYEETVASVEKLEGLEREEEIPVQWEKVYKVHKEAENIQKENHKDCKYCSPEKGENNA